MGWLTDMWKAWGGSGSKESLIRRLVKRRIAQDPNAQALGQTPAFADGLNELELLGLPEGTIVTCVETWATMSSQGVSEDEAARRIAEYRGAEYSAGGIQALIHTLVKTEHVEALYLPRTHVDWCIAEARREYGV